MDVVIIGAGQTGRGFIAPFMQQAHANITFVDQNEMLIASLCAQQEYQVQYFGNARPEVTIAGYQAYPSKDDRAIAAIANADLVTVSVFASNIASLVPVFQEAIRRRTKEKKLTIICIENGVHVKQPLVEAKLDAVISEGIIFCTSIRDEHSLTIFSQDYPDLPVDGSVPGIELNIAGMPLEPEFASLIQRKIYTYNFLSAVIAYLGSYVNYEQYADAANDPVIAEVIALVLPILNQLIAQKYDVEEAKQTTFAMLAIQKFQNPYIADSILRNAQQAVRKLNINERLLSPLQFAVNAGKPTAYFNLVIAAALHYGTTQEAMDGADWLQKMQDCFPSAQDLAEVKQLYQQFQQGLALNAIVAGVKAKVAQGGSLCF